MSGYDSNPFADPVDVNPFQVRLTRGLLVLVLSDFYLAQWRLVEIMH